MDDPQLARRQFITRASAALGFVSLGGLAGAKNLRSDRLENATIQEIIDLILAAVPGGLKSDTVDTIKAGSASQRCSGIVTTFMATAEVIQKTADLGANFIITHEPTYYNHLDQVDWLDDDPVYKFKKELIEGNGITIWRFHDYWHTVRPDGILHGFVKQVNWENYVDKERENICVIPSTTVGDLALFFKEKLRLKRPFIVGNPEMSCSEIALLLGASGGRNQIGMLSKEQFDVMVVGEVAEWETSEYIRDATFAGMNRSLIILGHAVSEEPGMSYLVEWLKPKVPSVPIHHVPAQDPFILV